MWSHITEDLGIQANKDTDDSKTGAKFCTTFRLSAGTQQTTSGSLQEVSMCQWRYSVPSVQTKELQGAINSNFSSFKRSLDKLNNDRI